MATSSIDFVFSPNNPWLKQNCCTSVIFAFISGDVAICTEVLEHLLDPLKAVGEIHRILKSLGMLVGSVPGRSPLWKLRWLSASRQAFADEPYHKHYSRQDIEQLLFPHFHIQSLYSKHLELNWFFVAVKKVP